MMVSLLLMRFGNVARQKVSQLYNGIVPVSENWNYSEKGCRSGSENILAYNVSKSTLTVYLPDQSIKATGTAVIVCPGGSFCILTVTHKGGEVACCLSKN